MKKNVDFLNNNFLLKDLTEKKRSYQAKLKNLTNEIYNPYNRLAVIGMDNFYSEYIDVTVDSHAELQNLRILLEKIDSAILRIKNGNFGQCIKCEGVIEHERLRLMPYSESCSSCIK